MSKITLVVGSTRQNRAAEPVSAWLIEQIQQRPNIELDVIDLKQEALPFFEAPISPSYQPDQSPHALAWGKKIAAAERVIFLTAEYNRSIPAPLKNAIDYLSQEWNGKPAAVVSYGYIDAGRGVTAHLLDVMRWLKMAVVPTTVHLQLATDLLDDQGRIKDGAAAFADSRSDLAAMLDELLAAGVPAAV